MHAYAHIHRHTPNSRLNIKHKCDLSAQNQSYVRIFTCGVIYHFVQYSLCYKMVKYYFLSEVIKILKHQKISNLKAHNNEKMAVKEKEPYFNII